MTAEAGQLDRRVEFRQRALEGASRTGAWTEVVTRDARVQPRFGGEAVIAARMAGTLPVRITVRRDSLTKTIDNSFQGRDARDNTIIWDIASAIVSEDLVWVEIEATQRLAGDDDE